MLFVNVIGNEKVSLREEDFLKMDAGLQSCQDRWKRFLRRWLVDEESESVESES